ncbi:hypothetical protein [Agarilytica rhodophyticola]|uniref:hypothetical protein n=1 Tax=Agarilytica rhodophyticola TaxID=1737490 RepID=UPI000B343F46|nr:hypothetical protein [Agarilytica rhodophyticola]
MDAGSSYNTTLNREFGLGTRDIKNEHKNEATSLSRTRATRQQLPSASTSLITSSSKTTTATENIDLNNLVAQRLRYRLKPGLPISPTLYNVLDPDSRAATPHLEPDKTSKTVKIKALAITSKQHPHIVFGQGHEEAVMRFNKLPKDHPFIEVCGEGSARGGVVEATNKRNQEFRISGTRIGGYLASKLPKPDSIDHEFIRMIICHNAVVNQHTGISVAQETANQTGRIVLGCMNEVGLTEDGRLEYEGDDPIAIYPSPAHRLW